MNHQNTSGGGLLSAFFAILLLASVALNVALLSGCRQTGGKPFGQLGQDTSLPQGGWADSGQTSESQYLREIAEGLGMQVPSGETTRGLAEGIKNRIREITENTPSYRGEVLSKESFERWKKAILDPQAAKTFEEYHLFIKSVREKEGHK